MELKEFIEKFVEKNTLIVLWYKTKGGHERVYEGDVVLMEWEAMKGEYANNTVKGVTDILCEDSPYKEAVNIVIDKSE